MVVTIFKKDECHGRSVALVGDDGADKIRVGSMLDLEDYKDNDVYSIMFPSVEGKDFDVTLYKYENFFVNEERAGNQFKLISHAYDGSRDRWCVNVTGDLSYSANSILVEWI